MRRSIFIVEDDHSCETVLRRIIRSIDAEAEITWVESAEQAILSLDEEFASGRRPDLIIADIFLSGRHTGLELWSACRERFPRTPVLITSSLPANRFLDSIEAGGGRGATPPFLPKPFRSGECRQILEGLLAYG